MKSLKVYFFVLLGLLMLGLFSSCEDDVLLEDINISASKGGSYGKLIMDNDSISNNYQYNSENKEIY